VSKKKEKKEKKRRKKVRKNKEPCWRKLARPLLRECFHETLELERIRSKWAG
jgi:hypothetical protein